MSVQPETSHDAASEVRGVYCQTSLLCCGYKMEAERAHREMELYKDGKEGVINRGFTFTHQSVEHLKKHSAEPPPVHRSTVRVA